MGDAFSVPFILSCLILFRRVWRGFFGIRDLTNIRCGIRDSAEYFDGKRDLTATSKCGRGMRDFLPVCREVGLAANANQTGNHSVMSPI